MGVSLSGMHLQQRAVCWLRSGNAASAQDDYSDASGAIPAVRMKHVAVENARYPASLQTELLEMCAQFKLDDIVSVAT